MASEVSYIYYIYYQISKQVLSNLSEITIFSNRHFMQLQTQNNVRWLSQRAFS